MALLYIGQTSTQGLVLGLSSDTKPSSPESGMYFLELDTGQQFNVQGGVWTSTYKAGIMKQVEVDFGAIPIKMKRFIITDSAVVSTNRITPVLSYDDPSDGELDSAEWFEDMKVMARAGIGQFFLYCNSICNDLVGKVKINYFIN